MEKEHIYYKDSVEQWGLWEIEIPGPSTGNPFIEQTVKAVISGKNETKEIDGFMMEKGAIRYALCRRFKVNISFMSPVVFKRLQKENFV